ncbi:pyroglutamyl-peptidase I [Gemella bergeri ATCC 700627]|uniref:Pyrrolidone-carboxylate peptidase n=1 Tax=Gemella bergeri ATCC 700627 TaxID=1321820 RepID=U2RTL3_9BACL|nr:pyroglutamyl-peptidase I [Gemella bergeri]ERK56898.1 pyroglutamyl-peptidase I [Gemella bergeri ATCC 700627]
MKVLITGFEPFNNENINPSELAVRSLPNSINNITIKKIILPTAFKHSSLLLKKEIENFKPHIVICVGQAGGRKNISLERIAVNIDDARIPDNNGYAPIDTPIRNDGTNAYFSTLPIKAIVENLKKENIPADISNTAGTFVCNHVMYDALYFSEKEDISFSAGFVHIPYIKEQIVDKPDMPFMELNIIVKSLVSIIKTATKYYKKDDISIPGGKES